MSPSSILQLHRQAKGTTTAGGATGAVFPTHPPTAGSACSSNAHQARSAPRRGSQGNGDDRSEDEEAGSAVGAGSGTNPSGSASCTIHSSARLIGGFDAFVGSAPMNHEGEELVAVDMPPDIDASSSPSTSNHVHQTEEVNIVRPSFPPLGPAPAPAPLQAPGPLIDDDDVFGEFSTIPLSRVVESYNKEEERKQKEKAQRNQDREEARHHQEDVARRERPVPSKHNAEQHSTTATPATLSTTATVASERGKRNRTDGAQNASPNYLAGPGVGGQSPLPQHGTTPSPFGGTSFTGVARSNGGRSGAGRNRRAHPLPPGGGLSTDPTVPLDFQVAPIQLEGAESVEARYSFRNSEMVGEGTYGQVYFGVRNGGGGRVALKKFKPLDSLDGLPVTSVREISILRMVATDKDCQKYCTLLEDVCFGKNGEDVYLVFPFVDHSLSGLASRSKDNQLDHDEVALLFKQLVTCLVGFERIGIIHRDLKPNNLLVSNDAVLGVCDFGLAVSSESGRGKLTPNVIAFDYRPPEMLLGCLTYTNAVDVWGVGCCLAQHYLRIPPFHQKERRGDQQNEIEQLKLMCQVLGPLSSLHPSTKANCSLFSVFATQHASKWGYKPAMTIKTWIKEQLRRLPFAHRSPEPPAAAMDVLEATIRLDPKARPTPQQLLSMPFFQLGQAHSKVAEGLKLKLRGMDGPSHDVLMRRAREDRARTQVNHTATQQRNPNRNSGRGSPQAGNMQQRSGWAGDATGNPAPPTNDGYVAPQEDTTS